MKKWNTDRAYFWETAPFFRILLPFIIGIFIYHNHLVNKVPIWLLPFISSAVLLLFVLIVSNKKNNIKTVPFIKYFLIVIILSISGFTISYFNDITNNKYWFGENLNQVTLARISDYPAEKDNSWKLPVSILFSFHQGNANYSVGNAFVYISKDQLPFPFHKGDTIILPAKWEPIKNAGNPYEFDYAQYCKQNNIYYRQFCNSNSVKLYASGNPNQTPFLEKSHDWCIAQLDKYIVDSTSKGLIQAMILGDEVNLDEQLRQSWSETGIVHIIAISGGNVAIFFGCVSVLLFWLKNKKHLWLKYLIAIPLAWVYVLMAGASPSAIRAAMMFSLLSFSIMLEKDNNSLNQLFATTFILLWAQPMWLFSLGLQLSFVAVLSLILFYKHINKWFIFSNIILKPLWATIAASISAEILVAPLVIYYFHNFPIMFVFANVLAFVFMGIVQVLSMILVGVWFLPQLAKVLGIIISFLVTYFNKIVSFLQHLNPEAFLFLRLSNTELLLVYIIIFGFSYFLISRKKQFLFIGLGISVLLMLIFCCNEWQYLQQNRIIIYNTNKTPYIEHLLGKYYTILLTDTTLKTKLTYAAKPAHIRWQAYKTRSDTCPEIIQLSNKSVLILKKEKYFTRPFHVDYLVVNNDKKTDFANLIQTFTPSNIITNNYISKRQKVRLQKMNKNTNSQFINVKELGSFIIENG